MNNCFAWKDGKCIALNGSVAHCTGCVFYKPIEQQRADTQKAKERCRRLGVPFGKRYRGPDGEVLTFDQE